MNVEDFRKYCLSLNGVTEKMPFGKATSQYDRNLLVFSIGDKWFCLVNIEVFDFCVLKSEPDLIEELRIQYDAIRPGYHMNHKHWISVYFNTDLDDKNILKLVKESYRLVLESLPKKEQAKYL
ncbi:hypothetical protein GCM10008015_11750 [Flavobacterium palustre]|uniref:MmcQ-like protein n=1 Tax=Flavobacterium palustre TaxID=1476463 RepID=A0ABQ1HFQ3_9FLAO|nr:MmcQ/YjbR family DNA-binding protein [Flavobacterium palustre]GGA72729.1 hypothetical protein GCM10008015_11750 [Flavobacterium palustre]